MRTNNRNKRKRQIGYIYAECLNAEEFKEHFIYLTNKSRGAHCSEAKLLQVHRQGGEAIDKLIKRLDPILYNTNN